MKMEEVINESFLAYKNDCMFYLNLALNDFLKDFNINFEIIEEENFSYENEYFAVIHIDDKTFGFIIYETLNEDDVPSNLTFRYGINYYFGGIDIYNKIIDVITNDLIINEINQIENLLIEEENEIESIDFQIKTAAYLMSKFTIPVEIALLCF